MSCNKFPIEINLFSPKKKKRIYLAIMRKLKRAKTEEKEEEEEEKLTFTFHFVE